MKGKIKPKRNSSGRLRRCAGSLAKLQASKGGEESVCGGIEESEEKFRKLAEKSVVGIYLIQDDLLRYVNPKFAEIFGYEVDEMING